MQNFDTISFWIQIHDLPLSCMNKNNTVAIGNTLGEVEQVDASLSGDCRGCYLRLRVNINITQPLYRRRYVNLGDSKPLYISLQYERMPIFLLLVWLFESQRGRLQTLVRQQQNSKQG